MNLNQKFYWTVQSRGKHDISTWISDKARYHVQPCLACERCCLTCIILNYRSSVCFSTALFSCLVLPIINIYLWATLKSWRALSWYLVSFVTEEQLFNIWLKGNFLTFRNWFKNLTETQQARPGQEYQTENFPPIKVWLSSAGLVSLSHLL